MPRLKQRLKTDELVEMLRSPKCYPGFRSDSIRTADSVTVHETHISWVFLIGDFAYKIKKPIATNFLDYQTLEARKRFCEQEVRLDSRFAGDLYLQVVPISLEKGHVRVDGTGTPIEYAVKMRRFADDALLSDRLETGQVTLQDVKPLGCRIADFHIAACVCDPFEPYGTADRVLCDATDNFWEFHDADLGRGLKTIDHLEAWTHDYFANHENRFKARWVNGFIRECHGDLHAGNIIHYEGQLLPFDGIEFNESLRWIDVINDLAFLIMDFATHDRVDLGFVLLNTYLEQTGDYESVRLLRFYLVYRALVRAKVAMIRSRQRQSRSPQRYSDLDHCLKQIDQAERLSAVGSPTLWITHGVSGSGKTTLSDRLIPEQQAIRLRSDIERKRLFGLVPTERPTEMQKSALYSHSATAATYSRLEKLAASTLNAGCSVIVDAAFLKRKQRERFRQIADQFKVPFRIVDCEVDEPELRRRIERRLANDTDASDADLSVLEHQLRSREHLTDQEREHVLMGVT